MATIAARLIKFDLVLRVLSAWFSLNLQSIPVWQVQLL